MNPILTFIAFIALIISIYIQHAELRHSREEFEKSANALNEQNVLANFYHLLGMYDRLVESMTAEASDGKQVQGRNAFKAIYSQVRKIYREKREKHPNASEHNAIIYAFGFVYRDNPSLAVYFRYLFNAIKIIETLPNSKKYIKILRSLISNAELLIIFYNCTVSKPGKAFADLAIEHELFDNMPAHLLDKTHASMIDPRAFGPETYQQKMNQLSPGIRGDLSITSN